MELALPLLLVVFAFFVFIGIAAYVVRVVTSKKNSDDESEE